MGQMASREEAAEKEISKLELEDQQAVAAAAEASRQLSLSAQREAAALAAVERRSIFADCKVGIEAEVQLCAKYALAVHEGRMHTDSSDFFDGAADWGRCLPGMGDAVIDGQAVQWKEPTLPDATIVEVLAVEGIFPESSVAVKSARTFLTILARQLQTLDQQPLARDRFSTTKPAFKEMLVKSQIELSRAVASDDWWDEVCDPERLYVLPVYQHCEDTAGCKRLHFRFEVVALDLQLLSRDLRSQWTSGGFGPDRSLWKGWSYTLCPPPPEQLEQLLLDAKAAMQRRRSGAAAAVAASTAMGAGAEWFLRAIALELRAAAGVPTDTEGFTKQSGRAEEFKAACANGNLAAMRALWSPGMADAFRCTAPPHTLDAHEHPLIADSFVGSPDNRDPLSGSKCDVCNDFHSSAHVSPYNLYSMYVCGDPDCDDDFEMCVPCFVEHTARHRGPCTPIDTGSAAGALRATCNWSPLTLACSGGHLEAVRFLLEVAGMDPREQDLFGRGLFWIACYFGHLPVAQYLHDSHGADPLQRDDGGRSALMGLFCREPATASVGVVEYLMQTLRLIDTIEADCDFAGNTAICHLARAANTRGLAWLCDVVSPAQWDTMLSSGELHGKLLDLRERPCGPLFSAMANTANTEEGGCLDQLRALTSNDQWGSLMDPGMDGLTALHFCVLFDHPQFFGRFFALLDEETLRSMLLAGQGPGYTALHFCGQMGRDECVRQFHALCPAPLWAEMLIATADGRRVLHTVASGNHPHMIPLIRSLTTEAQWGMLLAGDDDGVTPTHWCAWAPWATTLSKKSCMGTILDRIHEASTASQWAAQLGHRTIGKENVPWDDGPGPGSAALHFAAAFGEISCIERLHALSSEAQWAALLRPNKAGFTPAFSCALSSEIRKSTAGPVLDKLRELTTPAQFAALIAPVKLHATYRAARTRPAAVLLRPRVRRFARQPLSHAAAFTGSTSMILSLVAHGEATLDAVDAEGRRPIDAIDTSHDGHQHNCAGGKPLRECRRMLTILEGLLALSQHSLARGCPAAVCCALLSGDADTLAAAASAESWQKPVAVVGRLAVAYAAMYAAIDPPQQLYRPTAVQQAGFQEQAGILLGMGFDSLASLGGAVLVTFECAATVAAYQRLAFAIAFEDVGRDQGLLELLGLAATINDEVDLPRTKSGFVHFLHDTLLKLPSVASEAVTTRAMLAKGGCWSWWEATEKRLGSLSQVAMSAEVERMHLSCIQMREELGLAVTPQQMAGTSGAVRTKSRFQMTD